MSCCYGNRRLAELVRVPAQPTIQATAEKAMSGAEKVGMAVAIGAVLMQIFQQRPANAKKSRKARRRKSR
jgi:hypothetical protein